MRARRNPSFLIASIFFHAFILGVLALGFEFSSTLPVLENTNKNDVINAVILGDTPDSKILPQKIEKPRAEATEEKINPLLPVPAPAKPAKTLTVPPPNPKPDVSLKTDVEKKMAEVKAVQEKKKLDAMANDLLADIKKQSKKQKNIKHKQLKSHFEKTLHEQAEKSLRQQMLDEELRLQGVLNRQAQGEINKYKALILQAISERWIIPLQANKKLYCELRIRLAPSGLVLDVQITKSSGDTALDRSARAAVLKASPLPVPKDNKAFEPFREFLLKVKPENIITGSI